ncbi:MAG: cupin domain-containing protein [Candidatus Omnitrophota bacterium]
MEISVYKPSEDELNGMGVKSWPIWEKEESTFDWHYDQQEECLFLEGEVVVKTADGKTVNIKKGDFASFPKGLSCTWTIKKKVKKHYNFT